MSNYKKYAENLIGDWETGQYEPQRGALQKSYNTNWQKLTNEFNVLKDKLNKKMSDAQINYGEEINNIQNNAYNRMNNAYQDLANRGLTGSGMVDLTSRANTKTTGEEADKALSDLLSVTSEGVSGLYNAANKLAEQQSGLSGNLANALADVGDAESGNGQQYANLIAGIAGSAEGRAASRAASGGSGKSKKKEEQNDIYRRMGIIDILNDTTLSDVEKKQILAIEYDVSSSDADDMLNSYKYKALVPKLESRNNDLAEIIKRVNNLNAYVSPIPEFDYIQRNNRLNSQLNNTQKDVDALNKELSKYTYYDLWDILNR